MSACWEIDWSRFSSMMCLNAAKTEARRYLAKLDARPVTFIYEE